MSDRQGEHRPVTWAGAQGGARSQSGKVAQEVSGEMDERQRRAVAQGSFARSKRFALLLSFVALVATCLGACSARPPVGLGNCYQDLPLAEGALNAPKNSYVLHGVKLVSPKLMASLVKQRFPHNPSSDYKPPPAGSKVCAFGFTGNFPAGQVAMAPTGVSGKAAIVLTTTKHELLFSFVLAKLPVRFDRPFT